MSSSVYVAEGVVREDCTDDTALYVIALDGSSDSVWKCVDSCGNSMYADPYVEYIQNSNPVISYLFNRCNECLDPLLPYYDRSTDACVAACDVDPFAYFEQNSQKICIAHTGEFYLVDCPTQTGVANKIFLD